MVMPGQHKNNLISNNQDHIGAMSGPFLGYFRLHMIDYTKVISLKVSTFCSLDIVALHGDLLQPGGQLETPGLVPLEKVFSALLKLNYQNLLNFVQWIPWNCVVIFCYLGGNLRPLVLFYSICDHSMQAKVIRNQLFM